MKKYFFILMLLFSVKQSFAIDYSCFEYFAEIQKPSKQTLKVISDEINIFPFQNGELLNSKIYKDFKKEYFGYKIFSEQKDIEKIYDNDNKTYFEFDQYNKDKSIILKFENTLLKDSFYYDFFTDDNNYKFEISKDGKTWNKIEDDIMNYDLDYLKITFNQKNGLKNLKIYEFGFYKIGNYELLINSKSNDSIKIFKDYNCISDELSKKINKLNKNDNFPISEITKNYEIKFEKNTSYDISHIDEYLILDSDKDGIIDINDNCPFNFNPLQEDLKGTGIGDICNDVDNDNIIGYLDNCVYVANLDQEDINNNNIGDKCEFDKDKDTIFDSIDNCINISNTDQLDSDGDDIGDKCDNCNKYNPNQLDQDQNKIGDECEKPEEILDTDKDTISDYKDNCIKISNTDQIDSDKDGIGDICDNCSDIKNYYQEDVNKNNIGDICEDVDNDGILSYLDNCPSVSNADQEDKNNNSIGDACEDDDYDSILNHTDNCRFNSNENQSDADKDSIGDTCDKKDDRYIESNKNFFVGLMITITILFLFGIYSMIMKLKSKK